MSRGATIPELVIVALIIGVIASIASPSFRRTLERIAVVGAAQRVTAVHHLARSTAINRSTPTRYELDTAAGRVTLSIRNPVRRWDTVRVYRLEGVRLKASQRTVTFGPLGLGLGASNTRVVFSRGESAETLTVSRTGRLRRQ